jgi:hypothetical protein
MFRDAVKRNFVPGRQFYVASRVPSDHAAAIHAEIADDFPLKRWILGKVTREEPVFDRVRVNVVLA